MIGPRAILRAMIAGLVLLVPGMAAAQADGPAVLLVESSDGAHWAAVTALLEAQNLTVAIVPAPAGSRAALRRALASQYAPVVLVASGLGGAVMTEAGADPKVAALVYVAALAPEVAPENMAASREKQRFYAVAERDAPIPPELQRFSAARMKAKTIVLPSIASEPRAIAGLILEAAGMKPPACGGTDDNGTAACAAPALPRSLAEGCKCTKEPLDTLTAP